MPNDKNNNPGNFAQDREKASRAGQSGGQSSSSQGSNQSRQHMSEIGRKGGQSSGNNRSR